MLILALTCVENKHNMLTRSERGIWSGSGGGGVRGQVEAHSCVSTNKSLQAASLEILD